MSSYKPLALFWKEFVYRFNFSFLIFSMGLPMAMVLITNLKIFLNDFSPETSLVLNEPSVIPTVCEIERLVYFWNIEPEYTLAYEPSGPFLNDFMTKVACIMRYNLSTIKIGLEDRDYIYGLRFLGIENGQSSIPESLDYIIYESNVDHFTYLDQYTYDLWRYSGAFISDSVNVFMDPEKMSIQNAVDSVFLNFKGVATFMPQIRVEIDSQKKLFNLPCKMLRPIALVLASGFCCMPESFQFIRRLITERKRGITEYLKIMGLSKVLQRIVSVIFFLVILNFIFMINALLLEIPFGAWTARNSSNVAWYTLSLCLFLPALSLTAFNYFFNFFFKNAIIADLMYFMIYVMTMIYVFVTSGVYTEVSLYLQLLPCLLPQIVIAKVLLTLPEFAFHGKNLDLLEKLSPSDEALTLFHLMMMAVIDILLYFLLGAYLENIFTGKYGHSLPWYYPVLKSYWRPRSSPIENVGLTLEENVQQENFEAVAENLVPGLSVKNLSKVYKSKKEGDVIALNNVSIDFYEGEMCGLLGHNGAGKTTLISILCGMISPTSGQINIKGHDGSKDTKKIGYCPQHEMFIELLSVTQNLIFFGMAKGMSWNTARKNAKELISKFRMELKKNSAPKKLSGGQQRKLSLAIALMGNPDVIILDEPTAGVDIVMRRNIWDILQEIRTQKTVILCTHYMEEADALCDRIVVMSNGRIQCSGTPMYLKFKFGTGYLLGVVVVDLNKVSVITNLVKGLLKTATLKYQNKLSLVYQLSDKEMSSFPKLFDTLEDKKKTGEITSYTLTVSTMEDVFLKLNSSLEPEQKTITGFDVPEENFKERPVLKRNYFCLCCQQMVTLMLKKLTYMRRKWLIYLFLYALFIAIHLSIAQPFDIFSKENSIETIEYSFKMYKDPNVPYHSDQPIENLRDDLFKSQIENSGAQFERVPDVPKALKDIFHKDYHLYTKSFIGIDNSGNNVTILFNSDAIHAVPIALNLVHNVYLRSTFENSSIKTAFSLKYRNAMQETWSSSHTACPQSAYYFAVSSYVAELLIFLIHPLDEQQSNMKPSQLMLVSPIIYWLSHFIFDLPFIFSYGIIVCAIYITGDEALMARKLTKQLLGRAILGLFLHSVGILLIVYVSTCFYKEFSSSFFFILTLRAIAALGIWMEYEHFEHLPRPFQHLSTAAIWLRDLQNICQEQNSYHFLPFDSIKAFGIHIMTLIIILLLLEYRILKMVFHKILTLSCRVHFDTKHPKDPLVEEEEKNVEDLIRIKKFPGKILTVGQLRRWYCQCCSCKRGDCCNCNNPAVKGVSFTVEEGECFGLLGSNGAGKSSIFNILTGMLTASKGSAYLKSSSITSFLNVFCRHRTFYKMGYCPQYGNFFPDFKGREMLKFFARLRGLKSSSLKKEVDKWVRRVNIEVYEKRFCGNYSGGNQRKLATAIALIGNPSLGILDEPSTGVDPFGRRHIWDAIDNFRKEGQSVLLTTHSMEECDALCTRLAIISQGEFVCLGETTTLKSLLGDSYSVFIKTTFTTTEENRLKLKKEMSDKFGPGCQLVEDHLTVMQYQISMENNPWKKIFIELSALKTKYAFIESFSASSTSLEQIFVSTTKDK